MIILVYKDIFLSVNVVTELRHRYIVISTNSYRGTYEVSILGVLLPVSISTVFVLESYHC